MRGHSRASDDGTTVRNMLGKLQPLLLVGPGVATAWLLALFSAPRSEMGQARFARWGFHLSRYNLPCKTGSSLAVSTEPHTAGD